MTVGNFFFNLDLNEKSKIIDQIFENTLHYFGDFTSAPVNLPVCVIQIKITLYKNSLKFTKTFTCHYIQTNVFNINDKFTRHLQINEFSLNSFLHIILIRDQTAYSCIIRVTLSPIDMVTTRDTYSCTNFHLLVDKGRI